MHCNTQLLYIFILAFVIGNFVIFSQKPLLSLTSLDKVYNKVWYYDTFELRGVRSFMNKNPGTFILPPSTVSRVRSLKKYKEKQEKTSWRGRESLVDRQQCQHK